jgi:radical SAM protein with 4Fe4S-binding SPASM domain
MDDTEIRELKARMARVGLTPPKALALMITNDCNLHCRHCWPESRSRGTSPAIPAETLQGIIIGFVQLGVEEICLTGGEPLTHPDWLEIIRFSCAQPGLKRVRLQTNATLLTENDVEALGSTQFNGLLVQVSLEGATAKTHDLVRGQGSFDYAVQGLKLLAEAGLGGRTVVAFTETQHNFTELPQLLEILDGLGIGGLVSGTLVKAGRASRTDQFSLPTPSQVEALLTLYHKDGRFRERYRRIGNIACLEWMAGRATPSDGNCRCIKTPYITADGRMYPCILLPIDKYGVRDAHVRDLADVFSEGLFLWAELPELNRRRLADLEVCKGCQGRLHCAGGCMGRAYAVSGDAMTVEDRCALRQAVYRWEPPTGSGFNQDNPS